MLLFKFKCISFHLIYKTQYNPDIDRNKIKNMQFCRRHYEKNENSKITSSTSACMTLFLPPIVIVIRFYVKYIRVIYISSSKSCSTTLSRSWAHEFRSKSALVRRLVSQSRNTMVLFACCIKKIKKKKSKHDWHHKIKVNMKNPYSIEEFLLTLTLSYITKPHTNYLQNTQHVVLRNRPTLSIGTERLACLNNPRGVQLGTLA